MALNTNERLQEAFSLALEDRSKGYQDLVSNANAILYLMKKKGGFKPFSGPTIRERLLYNESGTYTRYSGYQYLNPKPAELFNDGRVHCQTGGGFGDAVWRGYSEEFRVQSAQRISWKNTSAPQRRSWWTGLLKTCTAMGPRTTRSAGLQLVIPTTVNAGTYGGISRADNAIWRTSSYDANSAFTGITQVTSSTIKTIFDNVMIERSRGTKGPDCIICSQEHYVAYTAAMTAIQRIPGWKTSSVSSASPT